MCYPRGQHHPGGRTASIYSRKEELRSYSVVLEHLSCMRCLKYASSVQLPCIALAVWMQ